MQSYHSGTHVVSKRPFIDVGSSGVILAALQLVICRLFVFVYLRYAELEQFTQLDFRPTKKEHCDEIVTKPTVFIKLDSGRCRHVHFNTLEGIQSVPL